MSIDTDFDNLLGDLSSAIADLESISAVSEGERGCVFCLIASLCCSQPLTYTLSCIVFLSFTAN